MPFAHGNNDALIDVLLPELADGKYAIMLMGDNSDVPTDKAERGAEQDRTFDANRAQLAPGALNVHLVGEDTTGAKGIFKQRRIENLRDELRWLDDALRNNAVHELMVDSYESRARYVMTEIMKLDGGK